MLNGANGDADLRQIEAENDRDVGMLSELIEQPPVLAAKGYLEKLNELRDQYWRIDRDRKLARQRGEHAAAEKATEQLNEVSEAVLNFRRTLATESERVQESFRHWNQLWRQEQDGREQILKAQMTGGAVHVDKL